MFASAIVYAGFVTALLGAAWVVKPVRRLGVGKRRHGCAVAGAGLLLVVVGLLLPARETRALGAKARLDEFVPVWQFVERHRIRVAAPAAQVFAAIQHVRADEIFLFRTLTWIRRFGRPLPESILNPGESKPLLDVATSSGFVRLAVDAPRELVIGTVVVVPPGTRGTLTPQVFKRRLSPGFALAAMNFLVEPDGAGGSIVSTETRVFANDDTTRRGFAAYWRLIYPGSAIIRRMWLRAIERRALSSDPT